MLVRQIGFLPCSNISMLTSIITIICPQYLATASPLWHYATMRLLSRKAYFVLLLGDVGILYLSVWVALFLRHFSIPSVEALIKHIVPFSILFLSWFTVYFLSGLYGRYTVLFLRNLPNTIFVAQIINTALAALFFFTFPIFQITPKVVLVIYLFVSTALLYFWRMHMYPHLHVRREFGAVLVGTSAELSELAEEVNRDPLYPLEFRAIIHPELVSEGELKSTLAKLVATGEATTIVADVGNRSLDKTLQFIYSLTFVKRAAVFIDARKLYEEVFERLPLSLIDERWILRYIQLAPHTLYATLKRGFDIIISATLGIVSLALYPFIILAIKVGDKGKGPAFYITTRLGRGEKPINIIKFRTMTGQDVGQDVLSTKLAVTKVGKFLRRSRLDELPQLWNILRGDMSFVGPRPEAPALVEMYSKEVEYYSLRHSVKPGLSGWAQIRHDNHPHHGVDTDATREKLAYDLYYIKRRSIWLDFYITILTLKTIITKKGS